MPLSRSRPRFTVRRLMVAVAIVGLLLGVGRWIVEMRTRSGAYRKRAFEFGMMNTSTYGKQQLAKDGGVVNAYDNEDVYVGRAWSLTLADKYWRLADRPWLPAEPDPPPPERLAHPRDAVDCPAELRTLGPSCRWRVEPAHPWWTFPWTWRNQGMPDVEPRWTFP